MRFDDLSGRDEIELDSAWRRCIIRLVHVDPVILPAIIRPLQMLVISKLNTSAR
jgi:hypothetical protein